MMSTLSKLLYILDARSKVTVSWLLVIILVGTVLELFGVGAVLPIVTLLSSSTPLQENSLLKQMHDWLQPESQTQFAVMILAGVILLYVTKNIYLFASMYLQTRFFLNKQYQLRARLFNAYLHSPYKFHLQHNSAELLRNLNLVANTVNMVIAPMMMCVTEIMLIVAIATLLIWVDPGSAIAIALGQGILVGGYFLMVRKKLTALGKRNKWHEGKMIQQVHQSMGSIKELKILRQEDFFYSSYSKYLLGFTSTLRTQMVLGYSTRFIVETVTIALVLGVVLTLLTLGRNPGVILATFSLFAVAAMRLMPTVNRFVSALIQIRFGIPSLDEIYSHLKECEKFATHTSEIKHEEKMTFEDQIELRDISFRHNESGKLSLDSIALSIPKRATVGFVGPSGAGKTTIVDVIIGLLKPLEGKILVDGKDIHESIFSWQNQIGYIPQSIYLLDDTVRNNVAFGLATDSIDDEKVWKALKLAQLDEFVESKEKGLDTMVGENGVRLSGGQRQRIGIARALYFEPHVLVMDEATGALDNETERILMENIETLGRQKTIIIIAHRLSTVKNCDTIFFLDQGCLLASGTYESLIEKSSEFRQLAGA
jgi:ATP-binding cassette subfamily C protein